MLKHAAGGFALTTEGIITAQLVASWAVGLTHLRPLYRDGFETFEVPSVGVTQQSDT